MKTKAQIKRLIADIGIVMAVSGCDEEVGSCLVASRSALKWVLGECDSIPAKMLDELRAKVAAHVGATTN